MLGQTLIYTQIDREVEINTETKTNDYLTNNTHKKGYIKSQNKKTKNRGKEPEGKRRAIDRFPQGL